MMAPTLTSLLLLLLPALVSGAKAKGDALLELTDNTLADALAEHPLMLVSVGVPECDVCARTDRMLRKAIADLRVKSNKPVTLARLLITSQDSPVIAKIVQGQLTLPKLIVFREGEAKDYDGARPPLTPDVTPLSRPIRHSPSYRFAPPHPAIPHPPGDFTKESVVETMLREARHLMKTPDHYT